MLGFGWIPPFSPFPQSSFWMIHKIESFAASLEYIPTKKFPSHSIKFISQKIPPKMRVCVIGAGVSGLPAIKACLEEGLEVKCFEKTSQIGGLWNYRPNEPNIGATVMGSTVVNTSKEMMAYSDFPPPPEWPNFMHHLWVQKYLEMYAAHFDLLKHIYFGKEVKKVERLSPMNWQVLLSDGTKEDFGAILICTGHHCDRNIPKLPGIDKFTGRIMHAQEYRDPHGFEGKNVFLLGIGNSALDIAVELAKIAKRVTISTRRGTWIFNRVIQWGLPYDVVYQTRFYNWLMDILPWSIANDFHEWRIQQRMDHDLYGLRPSHRFFQQHPAVNDSLANLLASGQITIADDILSIEEDSILVADGRKFETDILILCTGYSFGFPFLHPPDLIPVTENEVDLYKFVFPPSPMANGLAIIGLVQPIGSVAPISEMQARLAAATFSGRIRLPSEKEMRKEIEDRRRQMRRQYFESKKHTIQVKFIPYMDELAKIVGCMPDLKKLIWTEPGLALRLILGPNAPYVYRLEGPNRWEGARKAIAGLGERVKMPLKQRKSNNGKRKRMRKGMLDGGIFFAYSTIKCLALYLFIIFTFALWAFFPNGIGPFICFVSALAIIAGLAFLFQFDILWI